MVSNVTTHYEQRKAETRQKLIDAAQEVIADKGYVSVDVRDITQRAAVSRATFYKHFRNKESCVRALMQQGFDSLLEEILNARQLQDKQAWAANSLTRVYGWAAENRELVMVMIGGTVSPTLNDFGRRYMIEVIERTLTMEFSGQLAEGYPVAVRAHAISGIVIHLLGWWLTHETGYDSRQMGEMTRDIIVNGLGEMV